MSITNWGKYPVTEAPELRYHEGMDMGDSWIPRGMGRCYGDSSLGEQMISVLSNNRFLHFDSTTGILTCEAGVTYDDLLTHFVPKGWFPPVTPGTKFVSLGGAIASDVHGKNHHKEGALSSHVLSIELLTATGEVLTCTPTQNADVFDATFGGMGLTGLVMRLTIRLKKIDNSYIKLHVVKARNLDEIMDQFEEYNHYTYSVAWIDTIASGKNMGRSILNLGEHASSEEIAGTKFQKEPFALHGPPKLNIPINFPNFALNPLTVRMFNFAYYNKQFKKEVHSIQHYEPFFYPLDALNNWNRIYGKRGFTQYQFAIPPENGREGMHDILGRISKAGLGSFLAVLKTFGPQSGMMAFPVKGYTLALDFAITKKLFPFLDELDKVVESYGGRVYLTKDVRLKPDTLARMYPQLPEFKALLDRLDPGQTIRSMQSERLGLHGRRKEGHGSTRM
ncbi:FAD-binding oxidoreductase [bacterium]|nr:FAD-binding oxidoreductase [bacterium]